MPISIKKHELFLKSVIYFRFHHLIPSQAVRSVEVTSNT